MSATAARQLFYGVAAVLGLAGTWWFNLRYDGPDYLGDWLANDASSSAAVDLLVLAVVASVFMLAEARRLGIRLPLLYVAAGFVGAMAFAFPLFLLVRERALAARVRQPVA